jgi:uncharacterized protein YbbC (DUF1343 family)
MADGGWRTGDAPIIQAVLVILRAVYRQSPHVIEVIVNGVARKTFPCWTTAAVLAVSAWITPACAQARVRLGVEVLLSDSIHLVSGKRVGLITNHTGVTPDATTRFSGTMDRSTIDLLHTAKNVRLTALFAPEHGIRGQAAAGQRIETTVDSATGVPIYSLYGDTRVPTADMLKDVDVVLYDIQDVGARVYTYQWTMALSAEAVATHGKPFIVLDRPNPIRGDRVDGGVLNPQFRSFVGQYPVALRYGLTPGELLRYLVGTGQVKADIKIVPMTGWRRTMWWEETGLPWHNPSPNLRSLDAALIYTGTVFFEGTNLTEGRGTPNPFQLIGAAWLKDAGEIATELNGRGLAGVAFDTATVTVERGAAKWGGQTIPVISVKVTDRNAVQPYRVGLEMLRAIYHRHKGEFQWRTSSIDRLSGSTRVREAVELDAIADLIAAFDRESAEFRQKASPYLLYPPR